MHAGNYGGLWEILAVRTWCDRKGYPHEEPVSATPRLPHRPPLRRSPYSCLVDVAYQPGGENARRLITQGESTGLSINDWHITRYGEALGYQTRCFLMQVAVEIAWH